MMGKSRFEKTKNRREGGAFVPMPISVLTHRNYYQLTYKAIKLLVDMCTQLHFKTGGPVNNGDISIAWQIMQKKAWRSKETLRQAELELLHFGFVKMTRQGGRNRCNLYAVTWWSINECNGKLDVGATATPSNDWKDVKRKYVAQKSPKLISLPLDSNPATPQIGPMG